ncbi:MAG: hypothetical protein ABSG91_04250 [Syntrophobacteraceae bacterium]
MAISGISATSYTSSVTSQTAWTNQQLSQLKNLVAQGQPLNVIAQRMGLSVSAIKQEAATLGLNLNTK